MKHRKLKPLADKPNPTVERLVHAGWFVSRNGRMMTMLDDALGRALKRNIISAVQHSALERYALHWLAGGLGGGLRSVDLDRTVRGGTSEAWLVHRDAYRRARAAMDSPEAFVCDQVACQDVRLTQVGLMMGYLSESHGREAAGEVLRSGADRLVRHFDRDRCSDVGI